jgi:cytochrome c-type biogenesis protein
VSGVAQLVSSGSLLLAMPVAAAAGAVTFLSPCCLPLVPGFLSYVTGMAGTGGPEAAPAPAAAQAAPGAGGISPGDRAARAGVVVAAPPAPPRVGGGGGATGAAARSRVMAGAVLFVLGFSVLFMAYGAAFGGLGNLLRAHERELTQVLGGVTILLGLLFAGAFDRFAFAGRIVKPSVRPRAGLAGAPVLGVMFGLGWSPCAGTTLGTVEGLSMVSGTAVRGAVLAFVYALGLGVPFLLVAFGFGRAMRALSFARRHARTIARIGGALLICVGLLEVTGAWFTFITWLQAHWTDSYRLPF